MQLLGDGKQAELVVAGDKLGSFEQLNEISSKYRIARTVRDAKKDLLDKLWSFEEGGQTALGPALMLR